jgi:hypothetical protein
MGKIFIAAVLIGLFVAVFLFPGLFPIRAFDSFFILTCKKVIRGEFTEYQSTSFTGLGGIPIRKDYLECGKDLAYDANKICYVTGQSKTSILGGEAGNPLGEKTRDDCKYCQWGGEQIYDGKVLLGKKCRPYRFLWRWEYKTNF